MKYYMRRQDRELKNREEVDEILSKEKYIVTLRYFRVYREKGIDDSMKGGFSLWEKLQDAVWKIGC